MPSVRDDIAHLIRFEAVPDTPAPAVRQREFCGSYHRNLVEFVTPDGERIEAFLLQPVGPVRVAVLLLHQHNSDWSLGKSEVIGLAGDPLQAFGPVLAERGAVVLAPDLLGFESRLDRAGAATSHSLADQRPQVRADHWLQYYNHMTHRLLRGDLLIRKMLTDCSAGLACLQAAAGPGVRVGVLGHSMGGALAAFLAALDSRAEFACSSGAVSSFRYRMAHGIGVGMEQVIPGFAAAFDLDDVLACIAPRHVLVVSADGDPATGDAAEVVTAARDKARCVAEDYWLEHLRVSGGHRLDQNRFDAILAWALSLTGASSP